MTGFSSEKAVLVGLSGFFKGEEYVLEPNKIYVVGRSSSADISLKNTSRFKNLEEEGELLAKSFRRVSRRHFEITVKDNCEYADTSSQLKVRVKGSIKVIISSLASNSLKIDGREISRMIIPELGKSAHEITFGEDEKLKLFLRRNS
ncbi:MAG: FHA domain-containing protein [Planctomycetota bacterium]|nr:FHA domain-containing protein [Planctomycetota bacterium]